MYIHMYICIYIYLKLKLKFSLSQQEKIVHNFLDVVEVSDKIREM